MDATADSAEAYDMTEDAGTAALILLATAVAIATWFRRSRRGFP